jgi:hypothetical protein
MSKHTSISDALARPFLLPGDLACDALGLHEDEHQDLVRMLVNSLVWTVVGVVVVMLTS